MAELPLSNGKTLTVPDDATAEQAQQYYDQAEAMIKADGAGAAPVDDGSPVAVAEDQPGWDWLRQNSPGVFTWGHEMGSGIAEGVGDLPNAIPNAVNAGNEIYHLHADEPGAAPPAPLMDQWMTGTGFNDKSIAEMNPQTPGWERTRNQGRMVGTALGAAPLAAAGVAPAALLSSAIATPTLATAGGYAGSGIDAVTGNEDTHKWERTLEAALPFASGLLRTGGGALSRSGASLPKAGFGTYAVASAIDPSLPFYLKAASLGGKALSKAGASTGSALGDLLSTAINTGAPLATSERRLGGPR